MVEKHVSEFARERSQKAAAQIIGCTASAVSQMIAARRHVYIVDHGGGEFSWYEIKGSVAAARRSNKAA